jgi:maleate cis-trans isomerase
MSEGLVLNSESQVGDQQLPVLVCSHVVVVRNVTMQQPFSREASQKFPDYCKARGWEIPTSSLNLNLEL